MLGQVMPRAVRLFHFLVGGRSCYLSSSAKNTTNLCALCQWRPLSVKVRRRPTLPIPSFIAWKMERKQFNNGLTDLPAPQTKILFVLLISVLSTLTTVLTGKGTMLCHGPNVTFTVVSPNGTINVVVFTQTWKHLSLIDTLQEIQ